MTLALVFFLILWTPTVMAKKCNQIGRQISVLSVKEAVDQRFGKGLKIMGHTESSVSNIYTKRMMCHHSTYFTVMVKDSTSGKARRFVGLSVVSNTGSMPVPLELVEVREL